MVKDWKMAFSSNPQFKQNALDSIEKLGFPLELRARRILNKLTYQSREGYYTDEYKNSTKSRQIDIIAFRRPIEIKHKSIDVFLNPVIIADCKFSQNKNLLIFIDTEEEKGNVSLKFPLITNGAKFFFNMFPKSLTLSDFVNIFKIEDYSRKITDIIFSSDGKIKNTGENLLYRACEQVMPATNHFFSKFQRHVMTDYDRFYNPHLKSLVEPYFAATGGFNAERMITEVVDKFPEESIILSIPMYLFIPMIIINEDMTLIKTVTSSDGVYSVSGLEEIGYCVYMHAPENAEKYSSIMSEGYEQPIIVCNIDHLKECISHIDLGLGLIKNRIEATIQKQPKRIVEDILSKCHHVYPYNTP